MKRKLIIAFITISFVFASWNLINPSFENSNKDKLLIEIVKYVLEKYHYNSIEINDEFSEKMFDAYIELLDSQKKYFLASDYKEFKKYRLKLDNQLIDYDLSFFNLTHERLMLRISEVENFYPSLLNDSFDFYCYMKKLIWISITFPSLEMNIERKDRWRKQFKYTALDIYDIKVSDQKLNLANVENYIEKSEKEIN